MAATDGPLRLALATNNLFLGGAQRLVVMLASQLAQEGHDVAVVDLVGGQARLAGQPEPLRQALTQAGVPVVDFWIRSVRDGAEWRRAGQWFRAFRPDVVHGHLWPADRWAALLGRTAGAATLTTKHETRRDLPPRARWTEALAARLLFDRVVAISAAVQEHLVHYLHVPRDRIVLVPNLVDARCFRPGRLDGRQVRQELGLWPEEPAAFVVGYTGRLVARKGLAVWLEAASLAARDRALMRFVIVGEGPEAAALDQRAASLGLTERLRFSGPQTDVLPWLAACDAYLFTPQEPEGLPTALLEAMAMALPVVASNIGVHRELLQGVGLLPEPQVWRDVATRLTAEPFGRALVRLYDDATLRHRLGEAARARVLAAYDLPVVLAKQVAVYRGVLARRVRRRGRRLRRN